MHFTTVSISTACLLLLSARARATCYALDGSEITDASYTPCNPDAEVSSCCANNKGARSDICMSSGLCYAQDGDYKGFIYSNGCTDKTGLSNECPHFCPDGTLLVSATATTTTGAATVTVTTSTTAETTAQSGNDSSAAVAECPKDNTAVVGGAVGGVLGAALLASLGALGFMMKRRKDTMPPPAAPEYAQVNGGFYANESHAKPLQSPGMSYISAPSHEVPAAVVHEMHS
ncbi:hypothetical protein VP1G_04867 [Cytospora mali]|uniref:Carcinoembryonic antigen-related cell adhesion molecule 1 n=1 Tax=Cytospora mali TaxID=578113 RepID=A0A194V104_CYTMA|nr:hypothetical protein VP1G_04867 [Valsa mali var. pyri (nom. inval.)]